MNADLLGPDQEPSPDSKKDVFKVRENAVFIGVGGISGGGIDGPSDQHLASSKEPPHKLVCKECGTINEDVPLRLIEPYMRQHERRAHPDVFQKRRELQRSIRELDHQLWEH